MASAAICCRRAGPNSAKVTDFKTGWDLSIVSTGLIERHLAAIVAADVVGYSRLMGANERGTLAALKAHRLALIDPLVATHKGHIVKTTGDGLLLSFPSIVEAVSCAVAMQSGMARRNKNIAADVRIEFRIGVNLGDVIVEKGDVFGDGVNIAARLEQIAPPGGICLSEDAYRQVRGKLEIPIADAPGSRNSRTFRALSRSIASSRQWRQQSNRHRRSLSRDEAHPCGHGWGRP